MTYLHLILLLSDKIVSVSLDDFRESEKLLPQANPLEWSMKSESAFKVDEEQSKIGLGTSRVDLSSCNGWKSIWCLIKYAYIYLSQNIELKCKLKNRRRKWSNMLDTCGLVYKYILFWRSYIIFQIHAQEFLEEWTKRVYLEQISKKM